jgi:uncharacterized Zn-binding protein involved in type VI secretion
MSAVFPSTNDIGVPVLIDDFSNIFYPGTNTPIKDNVEAFVINVTSTISQWKLQMCNNEINTFVGARHLTSYQTGSLECDTYMDGYCASVASLGCAPNSINPVALPEEFRYCVCLVEENCFKSTYCTPDNPSCTTNNAFEQFIPVTCLGKNCSIEGYRWGRMLNQRCNITLCQQIINIVGDEIVIKGGSTMWCGNQTIALVSPTPTTTSTPSKKKKIDLPTWAWLLIGIGIFVLAIIVPLAAVLYARSTKSPKPLPANSIKTSSNP